MESAKHRMKYIALWLSLACVVVFVMQVFISGITENFMLTPDALRMPWQFLTAVFLHGGVVHLLFNLFALLLFGLVLESIIGSRKLLIFFLFSGVIANIVSFIAYPTHSALGASGAIMAVMGCLAILRPMMTVWVYNLPMPMFIAALVWISGSVLGIFGIGDAGIGYAAHLSGLVIGLIYGAFLRAEHKAPRSYNAPRIIIEENSMRNWEDWNLRR